MRAISYFATIDKGKRGQGKWGVALYLREDSSAKFIARSDHWDSVEFLIAEVRFVDTDILIGIVYNSNRRSDISSISG